MKLKIALFQPFMQIGNVSYNTEKIINFYEKYNTCDIILTPEMALSGYSPFDNLFNPDFQTNIQNHLEKLINITKNKKATLILGSPHFVENKIYNVIYVINNGEIKNIIYKSVFPNYGVFNESRYFSAKEKFYTYN